jgi:hypothetical protein
MRKAARLKLTLLAFVLAWAVGAGLTILRAPRLVQGTELWAVTNRPGGRQWVFPRPTGGALVVWSGGQVEAFNATGQSVAREQLATKITSAIALPDGCAIGTVKGEAVSYGYEGQRRWAYQLPGCQIASVTADPRGTLYAFGYDSDRAASAVVRFTTDGVAAAVGHIPWTYEPPSVDAAGNFTVVEEVGPKKPAVEVRMHGPDGAQLWAHRLSGERLRDWAPAAVGGAYVCSDRGLRLFTAGGEQWLCTPAELGQAGQPAWPRLLALPNGGVLAAHDSALARYDDDGRLRWRLAAGCRGRPWLDSDGNIRSALEDHQQSLRQKVGLGGSARVPGTAPVGTYRFGLLTVTLAGRVRQYWWNTPPLPPLSAPQLHGPDPLGRVYGLRDQMVAPAYATALLGAGTTLASGQELVCWQLR